MIYDINEFLAFPNERLLEVEHLYFGNQNLAPIFQNEQSKKQFLSKLQLCKGLKKLNLQNTQLALEDFNSLIDAVIELPLEYLNLRNNTLTTQDVATIEKRIQCTRPHIKCFALGASSAPPEYTLPLQDWVLNGTWTEDEIRELLEIAEYIFKRKPFLIKAHGYRDNNKKLMEMDPVIEIQTYLPWSALFTDGQALLLPKLKQRPGQVAEFIAAMKPRRAGLDSDPYRPIRDIKIAIHKSHNTADKPFRVSLIKSSLLRYDEPTLSAYIKRERQLLELQGLYTHYQKRKYKSSPDRLPASKSYLIMPVYTSIDAFSLLVELVNFRSIDKFMPNTLQIAANTADSLPTLTQKTKELGLAFVLQSALMVMLLHARNIVHNDIKPENFIIDIVSRDPTPMMRVRLVDLESATILQESSDFAILKHRRFTGAYTAPENTIIPTATPTISQDIFSFGVMARHFLFPMVTIFQQEKISIDLPESIVTKDCSWSEFLNMFFFTGIKKNYDANIAEMITSLTATEPQKRTKLPVLFLKLAQIVPELAMQAYQATWEYVMQDVQQTINCYPAARQFLVDVCPHLDYNRFQKPEKIDPAAINKLYRISFLSYFMHIYHYCNGTVPEATAAVFYQSITAFMQRPDITDAECLDCNFCVDVSIFDLVRKQRDFMRFILNEFSNSAIVAIHSGVPQDNQHLCDILQLQVKIWDMWDKKVGIDRLMSFASEQFDRIMTQSTISPELHAILKMRLSPYLTNTVEDMTPKPIDTATDSPKRFCRGLTA